MFFPILIGYIIMRSHSISAFIEISYVFLFSGHFIFRKIFFKKEEDFYTYSVVKS